MKPARGSLGTAIDNCPTDVPLWEIGSGLIALYGVDDTRRELRTLTFQNLQRFDRPSVLSWNDLDLSYREDVLRVHVVAMLVELLRSFDDAASPESHP